MYYRTSGIVDKTSTNLPNETSDNYKFGHSLGTTKIFSNVEYTELKWPQTKCFSYIDKFVSLLASHSFNLAHGRFIKYEQIKKNKCTTSYYTIPSLPTSTVYVCPMSTNRPMLVEVAMVTGCQLAYHS